MFYILAGALLSLVVILVGVGCYACGRIAGKVEALEEVQRKLHGQDSSKQEAAEWRHDIKEDR